MNYNDFKEKNKIIDKKRNNCYLLYFENHSELRWDLDIGLSEDYINFLNKKLQNINMTGLGKFNNLCEILDNGVTIKSLFFNNYNFNLSYLIKRYKTVNKNFTLDQFKNIFIKIVNIGAELENKLDYFEDLNLNHIYINKKGGNNGSSEYEILLSNPYSFSSYFDFFNKLFKLNIPEEYKISKSRLIEYHENNKENKFVKDFIDIYNKKIKNNIKSFAISMMLIVLLNDNLNLEFNNSNDLKKYFLQFKNKIRNNISKEYFIILKILENFFESFMPSFNYIKNYYEFESDKFNYFNNIVDNTHNLNLKNIENFENNVKKSKIEKTEINLNLKNNKIIDKPYPNNPPINTNKLQIKDSFQKISSDKFQRNNRINLNNAKNSININKDIHKNINNYIKKTISDLDNQQIKEELICYDPYVLNNRKNIRNIDKMSSHVTFKQSNTHYNQNIVKNNYNFTQNIRNMEQNKQNNIENIYKKIVNKKDKTNEVLLDLLINNLEQMNQKIKEKKIHRQKFPRIEYTGEAIMDFKNFKEKCFPEEKLDFNEFPFNQVPNFDPKIYNNQNPNNMNYNDNKYKKINLMENLNYHDQKAYLNLINKLVKGNKNESDLNLSDTNNLENILNDLIK